MCCDRGLSTVLYEVQWKENEFQPQFGWGRGVMESITLKLSLDGIFHMDTLVKAILEEEWRLRSHKTLGSGLSRGWVSRRIRKWGYESRHWPAFQGPAGSNSHLFTSMSHTDTAEHFSRSVSAVTWWHQQTWRMSRSSASLFSSRMSYRGQQWGWRKIVFTWHIFDWLGPV